MDDGRLERALTALRLRRYDLARHDAMNLLSSDPDKVQGHFVGGRGVLATGHYEGGRIEAGIVLRVAPNWPWARWLFAWCWLLDRCGDVDAGGRNQRLFRAQRAAEQALALDALSRRFMRSPLQRVWNRGITTA